MTASLSQIAQWLDAEVLGSDGSLDRRVQLVHGCDLMSDVLAFSQAGTLLLTGLTNPQVVRTAEVAGIYGVVFVRGKRPPTEVIDLAQQHDLPLLFTRLSMFDACGRLFDRGLRGWSLAPERGGS